MGKLYRKPSERSKRPLPNVLEQEARIKRLIRGDKEAQEKNTKKENKVFKLADLDRRSIVEDRKGNSYYCGYSEHLFKSLKGSSTIEVYFCVDEDRDCWVKKKYVRSFLTFIEELYSEEEDLEYLEYAVSKVAVDPRYNSDVTTVILDDEEEKKPVEVSIIDKLVGFGFYKPMFKGVHPTIYTRLYRLCKYLGKEKAIEVFTQQKDS